MEGADPGRGTLPGQNCSDPIGHLLGRLIDEGHGQDAVWVDTAGANAPCDAGGQRAGLARSCSREHQDRATEARGLGLPRGPRAGPARGPPPPPTRSLDDNMAVVSPAADQLPVRREDHERLVEEPLARLVPLASDHDTLGHLQAVVGCRRNPDVLERASFRGDVSPLLFLGQLSEGVGQSLEFAAARQRGVEACRLVWCPLAVGELAQFVQED